MGVLPDPYLKISRAAGRVRVLLAARTPLDATAQQKVLLLHSKEHTDAICRESLRERHDFADADKRQSADGIRRPVSVPLA